MAAEFPGSDIALKQSGQSMLTSSRMLPHIDCMMESHVICKDDKDALNFANTCTLSDQAGTSTYGANSGETNIGQMAENDTKLFQCVNTVITNISESEFIIHERKPEANTFLPEPVLNQKKILADDNRTENVGALIESAVDERQANCNFQVHKGVVSPSKTATKRRKQKKPTKIQKAKGEGQNSNTRTPDSNTVAASDGDIDGDCGSSDEYDTDNNSISGDIKKGHAQGLFCKKKHICNTCGAKMSTMVSYHIHMYRKHDILVDGAQEHKCDQCDGVYLSHIHLDLHVKNMHGDPLPCPQCGKLLRPAILLDHLRNVHAAPRFMCDICGQTCVSNSRLKGHIAETHDRVRRFPCLIPECGSMFFRHKSLEIHMKNVHDKVRNFVCPWENCDKSFATSYHLKRHVLLHTGDKPVKCQLCSYSCRQNGSLKLHMKNAHSQHSTQSVSSLEGSMTSDNVLDASNKTVDIPEVHVGNNQCIGNVVDLMKQSISNNQLNIGDNASETPQQARQLTSFVTPGYIQSNQTYPDMYAASYQNLGLNSIFPTGPNTNYTEHGVVNCQFVLSGVDQTSKYNSFYPSSVANYANMSQNYVGEPLLTNNVFVSKDDQLNPCLEITQPQTMNVTEESKHEIYNNSTEAAQGSDENDDGLQIDDTLDECSTVVQEKSHNSVEKIDEQATGMTNSVLEITENSQVAPKKKYAPPIVLAPLPEKEKKPKIKLPTIMCTECGVIFKTKLSYLRHMESTHGRLPLNTKIFTCPICSKTFLYEAQLQQHVTKTHGERMPCNVCGKMLKPSSLNDHIAQVHEAPRFKCDFCEQRCVTRSILRRHVQDIHEKVKRFRCSVPGCNTLFTRNVTYQTHMRVVHDKIKEYKCTWPDCDKEFGKKYHLKRHLLLHSGKKPINCHLCDYTCRQGVSLKLHLKNAHPDIND